MTSAEWMEIAEAYGTPPEERTPAQERLAGMGLCRASESMTGLASSWHLVCEFADLSTGECEFPFGKDAGWHTPLGDSCRCLMACLLAAMSDEERRGIGL